MPLTAPAVSGHARDHQADDGQAGGAGAAGTGPAGTRPRAPGRHRRASTVMNWQDIMNLLAPLRRQWDLAVLANLAGGTERPSDLIEAINAQAGGGRRIGWKVLEDTLRRLEASGYVARQEMPGVPRETRYRLRPPGHRLIRAVALLSAWHDGREPAGGHDGGRSGESAAGEDGGRGGPLGGHPERGRPYRDGRGAGAQPAGGSARRQGERRALRCLSR